MYATIAAIERLRPDIWTFWLRPERPFRFIAGQYIEIYVPHVTPDGRGQHRWFTISSTPNDPLLGITTQFVTPGRPSSYKQALRGLPVGTQLHISEPIGDFVLPKHPGLPIVMLAAGVGITPMRSMVASLLQSAEPEPRPIHLVHLAHTADDLLFQDIFLEANISYSPMLTQTNANWKGLRGSLTAQKLLDISCQSGYQTSTFAASEKLFYLSGPEELVMTIHDGLLDRGINRSQIVLDYFPGYINF